MNPKYTDAAPVPSFTFIQTDSAAEEACLALSKAEVLAVDTEFVREKYYFPRFEILQVSDGQSIYLFDIQALSRMDPIRDLLMNDKVLKLLHAADQDLELFMNSFGKMPRPIFDTQVAASLLGYGLQISLSNLIKGMLDVRPAGSQAVSDWSHRPLSSQQLSYAAADVQFLHEVYQKLKTDLQARERWDWFLDEQEERLRNAEAPPIPDEEMYRRVKEWNSLDRGQLAILRELAKWREQEARQRDQPRKRIFTDDALIDVTRFLPTSPNGPSKSRRINPGQLNRFFRDIKAAMDRGKACPRDQWPEKPSAERFDLPTGLLELCQALLRSEADRLEIAPTVLTKSGDLQTVLVRRDDLSGVNVPLLHGWRWEVAGKKMVDLLSGKLAVRVANDGNLVFVEE